MSLGLHIGSFLLVENMIAPIFVAYIDMYSIYCVYVSIYIHMFLFGESPPIFLKKVAFWWLSKKGDSISVPQLGKNTSIISWMFIPGTLALYGVDNPIRFAMAINHIHAGMHIQMHSMS